MALITGAIVLAVSGGVVAYATPAPVVSQPAATVTAPTTAPAAAPTRPVPEAEMVYLEELRFGGLKLSEAEQKIAVEIAREHVAHGHLNGMRYEITDDFFYRIPRLTTEERDIARIAVEHHFQQVTGRKQ